VWSELKSIISMPIHDSSGEVKLGVLNIDSDQYIDKTKFYEADFKDTMGLAADALGMFLEKKV
jgi:hypothetical protein